jgi:hypothetical protein
MVTDSHNLVPTLSGPHVSLGKEFRGVTFRRFEKSQGVDRWTLCWAAAAGSDMFIIVQDVNVVCLL